MTAMTPTTLPAGLAASGDLVVMRLRLIGQMEAWTMDSESVLPPGRKTRALLAIVALAAPRPVMRARLAELLWSRRPEEQARASLRQEIHRLLDVLAPAGPGVLSINRDSLALRPGVVWVDVEEVLRATVAHPASLALLDGELLESLDGMDPAFDSWLAIERERLRDRARLVAESVLRHQASPESLIAVAQQLLTIDRAHEGAWRALMRAHAERGERGLAIQSYDRCRAVLADLLDTPPSQETQDLLAEIRAGRPAAPDARAAPAGVAALPGAPPGAGAAGAAVRPGPAPIQAGARVGIPPLTLIGTDAEEAHLALGLAEGINAELTRFRWLVLVSATAIAQLMGQGEGQGEGQERGREHGRGRDDAALRRALGLDYLLDGSVQKSGRRLRITLRLVDLRGGSRVVWARRFDRHSSDLLALQDEVAAEAACQVDAEMLMIEARRAAHRPAADSSAYDLTVRALPGMIRLERLGFMQSGGLLRQAIAQDPGHAAAHAWYAAWLLLLLGQGWAEDATARVAALADAAHHAGLATGLDPQDARSFAIAGHVRAFLHRDLIGAAVLHERALALNPNLAMAWALSAAAQAYAGNWQDAERRLHRYKQLSPLDPNAFLFDIGFCHIALIRRDHEAAAAAGRAASALNPALSGACKPLLAALGHLGRHEEAAVVRRRLLAIEPGFTVGGFLAVSPFERAGDREHFAAGLRLAGIPEGLAAELAPPGGQDMDGSGQVAPVG